MVHQSHIISVAVAGLASWGSWVMVLLQVSPFRQKSLALPVFYISLFIALAATFSLVFYGLRRWVSQKEIHNSHLNISLRQGVLISTMLVIGLGFQRLKILTWWDALLLLAIILMIEFYFMSRA